jgi:ubiquinone/menaquinone biosynthesis C-methylase UbiE
MSDARKAQQDYYADTAHAYDDMHGNEGGEHDFAFAVMRGLAEQFGFKTILDVGSGTGRIPLAFKQAGSGIACTGVEPVSALRTIGHAKGLSQSELRDGDALALDFPDDSFDLVCAYAVLHHIKDHARAVAEMVRVARHGVFLSDANNFGQGSAVARAIKQAINAIGLWGAYDWMATRGKGYHYSQGDGVFYSYSVTNAVPVLRAKFPTLHAINTLPSTGLNLARQAPHMALFATNLSLADG